MTVGTVPFPEVDDTMDMVRGRFDFEAIAVPERGG